MSYNDLLWVRCHPTPKRRHGDGLVFHFKSQKKGMGALSHPHMSSHSGLLRDFCPRDLKGTSGGWLLLGNEVKVACSGHLLTGVDFYQRFFLGGHLEGRLRLRLQS